MADHDRPLNERGKKDAPRMGKLLRKKCLIPDAILSSTARRARDTALAVAAASHYPGEITYDPGFYYAEHETFWRALEHLPDSIQRVLVVGHNPDLEEFVRELTGKFVTLATAALAQVELPLDHWRELEPGVACNLVQVWKPRELD